MSFVRIFLLLIAGWLIGWPAAAQPGPPPGSAMPAAADYVLGGGDRIRVTVLQSPELSMEVRIPDSGVVGYPLLGEVALGGLTPTQAERRIAQGLMKGGLVRKPQVSIVVSEFRGNLAAVMGYAVRPGRYALESSATRLSDLLALAGGIAPDASDTLTVTGMRDGKPFRMNVNFRHLSTGADREHNIVMRHNDVVYIARAPQVYVYGEVQRPGAIRLEPGMRVLQALAAVGGPTLRGTKRGIRVSRMGTDAKMADSKPSLQEVLQPDDVVFVPESLF